MKTMKKIFAAMTALLPAFFAAGCSDPTEVYDTIPTTLCIVDSGLQNVNAAAGSGGLSSYTYNISVFKGGYNVDNAHAELDVDSNALSEYNTKNSTAYTLLSESYYSMPVTEFNLSTDSPSGISPVVFDIAKMAKELDGNAGYVLPVTLSSSSETNPAKKNVFIKVKFN